MHKGLIIANGKEYIGSFIFLRLFIILATLAEKKIISMHMKEFIFASLDHLSNLLLIYGFCKQLVWMQSECQRYLK